MKLLMSQVLTHTLTPWQNNTMSWMYWRCGSCCINRPDEPWWNKLLWCSTAVCSGELFVALCYSEKSNQISQSTIAWRAMTISKFRIKLAALVFHCGRCIGVLQMMVGNSPVILCDFESLGISQWFGKWSVCSLERKHLKIIKFLRRKFLVNKEVAQINHKKQLSFNCGITTAKYFSSSVSIESFKIQSSDIFKALKIFEVFFFLRRFKDF